MRKNQQWEAMRIESLNASRTIQQLRAALEEMETVRYQLNLGDQEEFDRQLSPHKKKALQAISKFETLWPAQLPQITETESEYKETPEMEKIQLQETLLPEEIELEQRKIQYATWQNLQQDINDLHELFAEFSQNVNVNSIAIVIYFSIIRVSFDTDSSNDG